MATIDQIQNLADPLTGSDFRIVIANPVGDGASVEIMQFRCTSAVLPGREIEQMTVSMGGHDVSYAGRQSGARSWTTAFTEGTDLSIIDRVSSWQQVAHDQRTGLQGESTDYKRVATIELLDGNDNVIKSRALFGLWPMSVGDLALDVTASSDPSSVEVTWSFDYWDDI